jgi:probable F420-dependent oxidoreductase
MQLGVAVPNAHETLAEPATIAAVARRAESLGFDSVWANDHVVIPDAAPSGTGQASPAYAARYGEQRGQRLYEPLITLAYLAGMTDRVLLGTSIYLLALRHPLLAAKQVVSLDALSHGRVILGVGVGWLAAEYAAVDLPFKQRGSRTDESLRILKALCEDGRADFDGRHYRLESIEFLPKPAQRPHPPVWIGGRSEAALRRAAHLGDAWHPSHFTCDELRRWVPELHAECERAGRSPHDVAVTSRRRLVRSGAAAADDDAPDPDRILEGSPAQIAATIAELEDVGVTHLIVEIPGSTEPELLEHLDWFGREVVGGRA